MKLQHLRFFTAVVECGGVIKAAKRLHLSQPAVSAGLKSLEEELGGALFERGDASRRLNLTPAGQRFYGHAVEVLKQCDVARTGFREELERKTSVRIGVLDTLPITALSAFREKLARIRPTWQVALWEGSVQRLITWLGQGRLDLAWTNLYDRAEDSLALWREPLVAVVSPAHRFAALRERVISIGELASEPFMHRSRCELDALGRAQLRAAGVTLQVTVRAERDELIFRLVREGRGITLAPQSLVPPDLVAVNVGGLGVFRTIGLHWSAGADREVTQTVAKVAAEVARSADGIDQEFAEANTAIRERS